MSTQKIPNSQKQFIQSNKGDYQGNVWETFNVDLDSNPGTLQPSKPLTAALDNTALSGEVVQALQIHDGGYYLATNDDVYSCSSNQDPTNSANWSDVSTLGAEDLGFETDMESFNGLLLVSLGTDIMSWNGSVKDDDWWTATTTGTALTADYVHTMKVLRTGNDTLFVTDKNVVRYYNTAAEHKGITLDTLMVACSLTPSLDRMWAGTYTEVEDNAFVYELRVGDDSAFQAYEIDGRAALTMFTYRNTPFVVTEKGYIQAFNGAGFETVAQFPWADSSDPMEGVRAGLVQDSSTSRAIHPKGAKVRGKYAYIFVDAGSEVNGGLLHRGLSGVWVLNLETYSLSHRYMVGAPEVVRSGPLLITNMPQTRIMVGSETSADGKGVWMESDGTPEAFAVTLRHEADSIADVYETFVVKADTLQSGETVTVKYKDTVNSAFPYFVDGVTWLNSTQFVTTDALTGVEVGDEIFIVNRHQAGKLCHITAIETGTSNTVTVDTALGTLNELSDIKVEKWRKLSTQMTSEDGEYKKFGAADGASPSRQYKVALQGSITVRELISKSNSKEQL